MMVPLLLALSLVSPPPPSRPFSTTTVFYVTDQRASASPDRYGFDDERYGFNVGECADGTSSFSEDCTLQYGVAQWSDPWHAHYYALKAADFFALLGQPKRALVFIHGFNERFSDAMIDGRTMASWIDYAAKEYSSIPVIVYGWPAAASTYSRLFVFGGEYDNDDANNRWSDLHLEAFVNALRTATPGTCLSVAAHSMGNNLAVDLLLALHDETRSTAPASAPCAPEYGKTPFVQHLISLEPDVDTQTYAESINYAQNTVGDVTVYGNERDRALYLSWHLHGHCRAGLIFCEPLYGGQFSGTPPPPWLNVIDASSIAFACDKAVGHSYYRSSSIVLGHIANLLVNNAGVFAPTSVPNTIRYWQTYGTRELPHYAINVDGCRYEGSDIDQ